jgi:rhodanese-related sulfurtransferase
MNDLISVQELQKQLASQNPPLVIDVRDAEKYAAGHIPGALHIPREQLAAKLKVIPKSRPIVTY